MHELAATQRILETALSQARATGTGRIVALHLVLGQMSEMTIDSVQFYWNQISPGTMAEGANLHYRHMPVELLCLTCDRRYSPLDDVVACPACGGERIKIAAGEEFYLEAIDVEPMQT